ncbi:MAG: NAD(P)-dependent oxidoreductase [Candidatus Omnitrophica bacterium]|nr:NAD(P)-dependent oxidoreductase [Candidatus Omnitrophota bacterium]
MNDNFWKDKRVLVTGGTGFLGKYMVDTLCSAGARVLAIDFRKPDWEAKGFVFREADIRDAEAVREACKDKDVVFHLAAIPSIARAKHSMYHDVNVGGTRNVLEGAQAGGAVKFLHVSSSTVYGIPDEFPLNEKSRVHPLGKYGNSKLAAEELCREFSLRGLSVSIIRPRVIMGAGRIGIFSILFDQVRGNKPVYILGKGRNVFQFTNVSDMVDACVLAAERPEPGLFNIGSDETLPVREELSGLIRHAGSSSGIVSVPPGFARAALKLLSYAGISPLVDEQFSIADKDFKLDTTHAREVLGWRPRYSNLQSLIQAYDWYIANMKKERRQFRNILGVAGKFKHSHMGGFQKQL